MPRVLYELMEVLMKQVPTVLCEMELPRENVPRVWAHGAGYERCAYSDV